MKKIIILIFLVSNILSAQELEQKWLNSGLTKNTSSYFMLSPSGKYLYAFDSYYHKLLNTKTKKIENELYRNNFYRPITFLNSDYEVLLQGSSSLATLDFQTGQFHQFDIEKDFGEIASYSLSTSCDTVAIAYFFWDDGNGSGVYNVFSFGVFIKDLKNNKEVFFEDTTFRTNNYDNSHFGYPEYVALSPAGDRIAIENFYDFDSTYISIYELKDLKKGALLSRIRIDTISNLTGMVYTPDSKHILTTHSSGNVIQWNASTGLRELTNRLRDTTIRLSDIRIGDSIVRISSAINGIWDYIWTRDTVYRYNFLSQRTIDSTDILRSYYSSIDTGLRISANIDSNWHLVLHDIAADTITDLSVRLRTEWIVSFYGVHQYMFSRQRDSSVINQRTKGNEPWLFSFNIPYNSTVLHSKNGTHYLTMTDSCLQVFELKNKNSLWSYKRPNCFKSRVAFFAENDSSIWVVIDPDNIIQFSTAEGIPLKTVKINEKNPYTIASIAANSDNTELLSYLWIQDSSGSNKPYIARIALDGNYVKSKYFYYSFPSGIGLSYIDDQFLLCKKNSYSDNFNRWFCVRREDMDTVFEYKLINSFTKPECSTRCYKTKELNGFFLTNTNGDIVFYRYNNPEPVWQMSLEWPIAGFYCSTNTRELFFGSYDGSIRCFYAKELIKFLSAEVEIPVYTEGNDFFPNPVNDLIHFRPGTQAKSVRIINILGNVVLSCPFSETIYVGGLAQGIYFLDLGGKMYKFVKQ